MTTESRMSVWICPECGEQEQVSAAGARPSDRWRRWREYPGDPEYAVHWHGEEDRGKPAEYVKAEEVEVIPADQVEQLQAERDQAQDERASWKRIAEQQFDTASVTLKRVSAEFEEFKERLTSDETIHHVYAAGPYGEFDRFLDEGVNVSTNSHSPAVYRSIVADAIAASENPEAVEEDKPHG